MVRATSCSNCDGGSVDDDEEDDDDNSRSGRTTTIRLVNGVGVCERMLMLTRCWSRTCGDGDAGSHCPDSCTMQAWSTATILDALHELETLF